MERMLNIIDEERQNQEVHDNRMQQKQQKKGTCWVCASPLHYKDSCWIKHTMPEEIVCNNCGNTQNHETKYCPITPEQREENKKKI